MRRSIIIFKFTEKLGDIEMSFESDTIQGVIDLKNATHPDANDGQKQCCGNCKKDKNDPFEECNCNK